MWKFKQIEVKNRTYYFYNDIINIEEFHSNLLKIDIYYSGYITIKKIAECENIDSVNPMYLIIGKKDGHIEGENGSKYLVFESKNENNGGKKGEYDKDFMKIKFDTDYNLPLNKQLKLHLLTIIVRSVFEEHGKFYLHLYSDNSWYEL